MLKDLKLESQTFEELYGKAKSVGNISSIQEIYENKPKKSLLIGKIVEIGELIRKDGVILRDSLEFLMKELGADGKYSNYFGAVLFGDFAIEAYNARFMLSDKLLFWEPKVFKNPQFDQQKSHLKLFVQVGLCHNEDEVIWYSRKYSEEHAVVLASPQKTLMKINDNKEPGCSSSCIITNSAKDSLHTAAEKNMKINENNKQYNKNTSKSIKNWITNKDNKQKSNIIHKRLLFACNSDAPFVSDSELLNNSTVQMDPRLIRSSSPQSSPLINNNNNDNNNNINNEDDERDSAVETNDTRNNQPVLSKYFNRNNDNTKSPEKHKVSPQSIMKPAVLSDCNNRKDDSGGSRHNKENETSDFLNILEEVSVAMKLKYLSSSDHTNSTKESPKEVVEANRNVVEDIELVTLDDDYDDDDDDPDKLTNGTQQCRNTSLDSMKTSFEPEHTILKREKIKSNNDRKLVKTGMVLNNHNSKHGKPKSKQVTGMPSHSGHHLSSSKASESIIPCKNSRSSSSSSSNNNNNNNKHSTNSKDAQVLNSKEEKKRKKLISGFKDTAKATVHGGETVSNKIDESRTDNAEQKIKTSEFKHNHGGRLCEGSQTLLIEDGKKTSENVTSISAAATSSVLPSPTKKICHEVGDKMRTDDYKSGGTSADKTTPTKLVPALKSPCSNDKQIVGRPSRKKRVSFALSDEENDEECEARPIRNPTSVLAKDHKARPAVNCTSVLADNDFTDYILNVLLQSPSTNVNGDSSNHDCGSAIQESEKYSTLNRNVFSNTALSADIDSDNVVAVNAAHSVDTNEERRNCDYAVQSVITDGKVLKKLLSDNSKKKVFINTICVVDESQSGSGIDGINVTDSANHPSGSEQHRMITAATTRVVPCCTQDSVVSCIGSKRKLDDKTSCCNDSDSGSIGPNSINLAKVQKVISQLMPNSQQRIDFSSSSSMLVEVNWPALSTGPLVKRDVSIGTSSYSKSDGGDDYDADIAGAEGRWFVLSGASLIDVYPPLSGNALDLVSGFCNHNCFHRYSELIWVKNDNGNSESVCPIAFKTGIRKPSPVIFMLTFIVTDREGKCYNLRVYKEHAESLLCCKVTDFINDKDKRAQVIASMKSYIVASAAECSTSEVANKKKLTLCVYDKGSIQIVVQRVETSTLKL